MSEITEGRAVKKQPRKRKLNFSKEEQLQIVEFVKKRPNDIWGKAGQSGAKVDVKKRKAWEELAVSLRSSGGQTERTWRDIRKKWWVLKRRAMSIYRKAYMLTGERPTPNDVVNDLVMEKVLEVMAPEGVEIQPILGIESETGFSEGSWSRECTNSQRSEDDISTNTSINDEREGTGMENLDEGVVQDVEGVVQGVVQDVENLNTVTRPDLIHSDLLRISAQLDTIIELLRALVKVGKEQ